MPTETTRNSNRSAYAITAIIAGGLALIFSPAAALVIGIVMVPPIILGD